MATHPNATPTVAPLESWIALHPAALAWAAGERPLPPAGWGGASVRSAALAEALAEANRRWGNPVDRELERWRAGAAAVVTGQQPGLAGGPLLTLVKACAVAAEVRRLAAQGTDAVGFLWLATGDDDLPEMGWARLAVGEEVVEVREPGWQRGDRLAGAAPLSGACAEWLASLAPRLPPGNAQDAAAFAASCYAAGVSLGEATARFLARLLAGTGIVLVDALEPALARASAPAVAALLARLDAAWQVLEAGAAAMQQRGWPVPLRLARQKLPVFRREGDRRVSVPTSSRGAAAESLDEQRLHPERFLPNAWVRPLVADAAFGTAVSVLGGAELAYHLQGAGLWELAGLRRPEWRLRPHVTVITAAERRLAAQLRVAPEQLLRARPPLRALPGKRTRRQVERLHAALDRQMAAVAAAAREELPGLGGDVDATANRLSAAAEWLDGRLANAAARDAEVEMGRWRRLVAFVRPHGQPQERHLSVLAPLLRLGLDWPRELAAAIDPEHPGMQLLCWEDGRW